MSFTKVESSTSRCQTFLSIWALREDRPIPRVTFIRWTTTLPLDTVRSLRSAFILAWWVSLAIKLPSAFAPGGSISDLHFCKYENMQIPLSQQCTFDAVINSLKSSQLSWCSLIILSNESIPTYEFPNSISYNIYQFNRSLLLVNFSDSLKWGDLMYEIVVLENKKILKKSIERHRAIKWHLYCLVNKHK